MQASILASEKEKTKCEYGSCSLGTSPQSSLKSLAWKKSFLEHKELVLRLEVPARSVLDILTACLLTESLRLR